MYRWPRDIHSWLDDFIAGTYRFSPRIRYHFTDETPDMWEYRDRLMLTLLFQQIKSTFSHLISKCCLHVQGPNGVKTALTWLHNVMNAKTYQYVIRAEPCPILPTCPGANTAMRESAVNPAEIKRYLHHWADWWANTMVPITTASILQAWRDYTGVFEPALT